MASFHKAVLRSRISGVSEFRNVFYGEFTYGDTLAGATWAGYFDRLLSSSYLALLKNVVTFYGFDLYNWDGNEWQPMTAEVYSKVGTVASGDYMPLQVAAVLVAKTTQKRSFGRKFLAGFVESQIADGAIISAALTTLATVAANWIAPITVGSSTITPGLWTKDNTFVTFIGAVVDVLTGTQRRRKPGVGI